MLADRRSSRFSSLSIEQRMAFAHSKAKLTEGFEVTKPTPAGLTEPDAPSSARAVVAALSAASSDEG